MTIEDLPYELLLEILLFLDIKQILASKLIAKPFKFVINNHILWRELLQRDFPGIKVKNDSFFEAYKAQHNKCYVTFTSAYIRSNMGLSAWMIPTNKIARNILLTCKNSKNFASGKFFRELLKQFGLQNIFAFCKWKIFSLLNKQKDHESKILNDQVIIRGKMSIYIFTLGFNISKETLKKYIDKHSYKEISKHLVSFKDDNGTENKLKTKRMKSCVIS